MAQFGYAAINDLGTRINGTIEASNENEVIKTLRGKGLTIVEITQNSFLFKDIHIDLFNDVTEKDLSIMCRQFVSLFNVGIPIKNIFTMISEQSSNKILKKVLEEIVIDIEKGNTLTEALQNHNKYFPENMISMVKTGEATGDLSRAFEQVAIRFEKITKTKALIKKSLIYPVLVLVVSIIISIIMLVKIIPSYETLFIEMGAQLPTVTRIYVALSHWILRYWFLIISIILCLFIGLNGYKRTDSGKHFFGKIALAIPLFGRYNSKVAMSQIARSLSSLIESGVQLLDAIVITAGTMKNVIYKDALNEAAKKVGLGKSLSQALSTTDLFSNIFMNMLKVGEETGETEKVLSKVSDYYDDEIENTIGSMMSLLEPVIILILAIVIGGLILACMAPMVSMYSTIDYL